MIPCALRLAMEEHASLDEAFGLPYLDHGRMFPPLDSRDARSALGLLPSPCARA